MASTAVEAMSVWVSIRLTTMEMEQGSIDGEGGGAANWANDDGDGGNGSAQPCRQWRLQHVNNGKGGRGINGVNSHVTRGQGVNHIYGCGLEAASKAVKER